MFAEFIGFAVIFVISDYEVGVFYDIAVTIDDTKPSISGGTFVRVNPIIARSSFVDIMCIAFADLVQFGYFGDNKDYSDVRISVNKNHIKAIIAGI